MSPTHTHLWSQQAWLDWKNNVSWIQTFKEYFFYIILKMVLFLSKHKLTLKFVNHFWQTITKNWISSHACWNTRWARWAGLKHFLCGTLLELINKEIFPEKMIEHKCTTQYNLLLLLLKVHLSSSTFVKHRFPKYSCTYCTYND